MNPNLVKTSNKLIGHVENGDLYADDEGLDFGGRTGQQDNNNNDEPDYYG